MFKSKKIGKNEILFTAKKIFAEKGGISFSMREVANTCGKSLSHIQYYFPSINDLLSAMFDDIIDDSIKKLDEFSQNGDELVCMVDLIVRDLDNVALCKLVWETWINSVDSDRSQKALNNFHMKYVERINTLILRRFPQTKSHIAKRKAVMIVSLFEGLASLYISGKDTFFDFDLRQVLHDTANTIIAS